MANGNYNKVLYKDKVTTIYDVVYNKGTNIHKQLYNVALNNYIKHFCQLHNITTEVFNNTFKIIEKLPATFDKASVIIQRNITSNTDFDLEYIVDLSIFWPKYVYTNKSNKQILVNPSEQYNKDEITYIDYVRGEATLYNKINDIYYNIPLNNITKDTQISDSMEIK